MGKRRGTISFHTDPQTKDDFLKYCEERKRQPSDVMREMIQHRVYENPDPSYPELVKKVSLMEENVTKLAMTDNDIVGLIKELRDLIFDIAKGQDQKFAFSNERLSAVEESLMILLKAWSEKMGLKEEIRKLGRKVGEEMKKMEAESHE